MSEPLDFTSAGRQRNAPPPSWAPEVPRQETQGPAGSGPPRLRIAVVIVAAVVVVAVGVFVLFGRGGKKSSTGNPATLARYCQLAAQFDALAAPTATADTSVSAISEVLKEMGGTTAEMEADAPAAIHADVVAMVTALQEAEHGNPAGIRSPSYLAHRQRLTGFRQNKCVGGAGNNDQ